MERGAVPCGGLALDVEYSCIFTPPPDEISLGKMQHIYVPGLPASQ